VKHRTMTKIQGQYLAFIWTYTKVNGRAPAEADIQRYFGVSPPTVHDMLKRLEARGLISRKAGVPRSARILVPESELPRLE
jgi:Mn-dependent DtxR family transcriptional regulator